jgi:hypothetical protein
LLVCSALDASIPACHISNIKAKMRALAPPAEVREERNRQEVFRAWIDGGMLSISLCNVFPESYRDDPSEIWGIFISDIFHHVVDAIVLETGRDHTGVKDSLRQSFEEVFCSARGTRYGTLKQTSQQLPEIPDPDVIGDDNCVEIVRIALLPDSIRVMVLVGMRLPDNEESVWGNLLYDTESGGAGETTPPPA